MPRRARLILAGIPVHVVQRGNNRQDCFRSDSDRRFYLHHLRRLLGEEECSLHSYCLMTNHVHLLVTSSGPDGTARLMKHLGQLHTQYMNRTYGRTGTLWEGRFRSSLVQSAEYLLTCYRYIECNPVRAGLVDHPAKHDWSSYRSNALGCVDPLVTPHSEYECLGTNPKDRQRAYESLFSEVLGDATIREIREASSGNFPLGDSVFAKQVAEKLGRRAHRGAPGRPRKAEKRGLSLIS
jgi:putative transposase